MNATVSVPRERKPTGEKTIKQLDPCHTSVRGEMQGSLADNGAQAWLGQ